MLPTRRGLPLRHGGRRDAILIPSACQRYASCQKTWRCSSRQCERPSAARNASIQTPHHSAPDRIVERIRNTPLDGRDSPMSNLALISCLVGTFHAPDVLEPRTAFRTGAEQMTYIRSRPWRPRGPWFCNRASARRRGRRSDEVEFARASEMTFSDGVVAEPQSVIEEDVLLPVVVSQTSLEPLLATSVNVDAVLAITSGSPAVDSALRQLDRGADEVIATHLLAQQRDDAAASRQSA